MSTRLPNTNWFGQDKLKMVASVDTQHLERQILARSALAVFYRQISKEEGSSFFYIITGGDEHHASSLHNRLGMSKFDFDALHVAANLCGITAKGTFTLKRREWDHFLEWADLRHDNLVERIEPTRIDLPSLIQGNTNKAASNYHLLRVGKKLKNGGSPNSFQDQVDKRGHLLDPPRVNSLNQIQRTLRRTARRTILDTMLNNDVLYHQVQDLARREQLNKPVPRVTPEPGEVFRREPSQEAQNTTTGKSASSTG